MDLIIFYFYIKKNIFLYTCTIVSTAISRKKFKHCNTKRKKKIFKSATIDFPYLVCL